MSKSTPLSQLNAPEEVATPEMPGGNAYDEKENQLVNEILTEINNNEAGEDAQNLLMELNDPVQEAPAPVPAQPQKEPEPTREQLSSDFNLDEDETTEETSLSSVQDEIISRIKLPLLAGALVVLFSTPQVTKLISKLIPPKEIFQNHKALIGLVAKFILSTIVFTAVQFAV